MDSFMIRFGTSRHLLDFHLNPRIVSVNEKLIRESHNFFPAVILKDVSLYKRVLYHLAPERAYIIKIAAAVLLEPPVPHLDRLSDPQPPKLAVYLSQYLAFVPRLQARSLMWVCPAGCYVIVQIVEPPGND